MFHLTKTNELYAAEQLADTMRVVAQERQATACLAGRDVGGLSGPGRGPHGVSMAAGVGRQSGRKR